MKVLTPLEKMLLAAGLLFGVLTLTMVVARGGDLGFLWGVPSARAASGTYYGANDTTWAPLAANEWPQKNGNWCGVANIEMIGNYTFQVANNDPNAMPFHSGGQQKIANDLNSASAVSRWGVPSPGAGGPGFRADIARDGGTDPRAIAWGIFYESAYGGYLGVQQAGYVLPSNALGYHNVIYHTDASHALGGLARTLERYRLPVSVTIAHGLHSDVVTGVWSSNDPVRSYPAAVTAVATWDPEPGAYQAAMHVIWDAGTFISPTANLWGRPYDPNYIGGIPYDPDPAVGIYTPGGSFPHHWIGYYVDIEPDSYAAVSPDFAVDETGNVMLHP